MLASVLPEISATFAAGFEFGWLEEELAEKLGCSAQTLADKRKAGEIDSTRNPAGRPFYMPHHVLDYLMRHEIRNGKQLVAMADVIPFTTREERDDRQRKVS